MQEDRYCISCPKKLNVNYKSNICKRCKSGKPPLICKTCKINPIGGTNKIGICGDCRNKIEYKCLIENCNNKVKNEGSRCSKHQFYMSEKNTCRCTVCGDKMLKGHRKIFICDECKASKTFYCVEEGCTNVVSADLNMCRVCCKLGDRNPVHKPGVKEKISKSLMGRPGVWQDKKLSDSHKRNISESLKGDKNPMFGMSFFDAWVIKYGEEIAENKLLKLINKHKENHRVNPMTGSKNSMYGYIFSDEQKQKWSIDRSGSGNPMYGVSPKWHRVVYADRNNAEIKMKSTYELERAQFLDSISANWKYEEITYKLENTTYTPDFFIYDENNNLIRIEEVKGWMRPESKEKMQIFIEKYDKESKIFYILFKEDLLKDEKKLFTFV